jgi:hypothetical protein
MWPWLAVAVVAVLVLGGGDGGAAAAALETKIVLHLATSTRLWGMMLNGQNKTSHQISQGGQVLQEFNEGIVTKSKTRGFE